TLLVTGDPAFFAGQDYPDVEVVLFQDGAAARPASEVLVYACGIGPVPPDWLRTLVAPLADRKVGVSTGFREYLPRPPAFWPLLRSAWNSVASGRLGSGDAPFAWPCAMAVRRSAPGVGRTVFAPGAITVIETPVTAAGFLRQAAGECALLRRTNPGL